MSDTSMLACLKNPPSAGGLAMIGCPLLCERILTFASLAESSNSIFRPLLYQYLHKRWKMLLFTYWKIAFSCYMLFINAQINLIYYLFYSKFYFLCDVDLLKIYFTLHFGNTCSICVCLRRMMVVCQKCKKKTGSKEVGYKAFHPVF